MAKIKSTPYVSVIIPVFNDAERLKICLEALEDQSYPKNLYEIIVIDNGSDQSIEQLVSQYKQSFSSYESTPGSYNARNKGISLAKGEILAFTDADCIPKFNWLETGVENLLSSPNYGLIAGKINIFFQKPDCPTVSELYDSITFLNQEKYIREFKFGATANLFTFKDIFQKVGLFDGKLKSCGDKEWGNRVAAYGYSLHYADHCCVSHPARSSLKSLYKKIVRVETGNFNFCKDKNIVENKQFLHSLLSLNGLRPPLISTIRQVVNNKSLKTKKQKIEIFWISLFVYYVRYFQIKKLKLKS